MATIVLLAFIGWIVGANLLARAVYKRRGFIAASAAFVAVLVLPFADAIPGYLVYRYYIAKDGGLHIYDSVRAAGYLQHTASCAGGCIEDLIRSPYGYIELFVSNPNPHYLTDRSGYAHIFLSQNGDSRCARFHDLYEANPAYYDRFDLSAEQCIGVVYTDVPISKYERAYGGPYRKQVVPPFLWIRESHVFVRNLSTGRIIAETKSYRYWPLIANIIGFPEFRYNTAFHMPIDEVLLPSKEVGNNGLP